MTRHPAVAEALPNALEEDDGSGNFLSHTISDLTEMRLNEAFESAPSVSLSDLDEYEQLDVGDVDVSLLTRAKVRELIKQQVTPNKILLRDKLAFVLGTVMAMLSAYWLGWSPTTFYRVYTIEAAVLFTLRWVMYRMKKWHYYMFDFCYVANVLLLVHIWVFPHSAFLHKVTFAYATGPLAWSVIAFRNSLVFHSVDKITSLFLHWFPACVAWTERWHPDVHVREHNRKAGTAAMEEWHNASLWDLVVLPMAPYLLWALLYYLKIFVMSSRRIQQRGYDTLFKYTTANPKSAISVFVKKFPTKLQPLAYMGLHISLTAATFAVCKIWWMSCRAHTAFLLCVLCISAWNGASFYFEVFAHRYVAALGLPRKPLSKQTSKVPAGDAARTNGMAQSQKSMPPASPLSLDPLNVKEACKSGKDQ